MEIDTPDSAMLVVDNSTEDLSGGGGVQREV